MGRVSRNSGVRATAHRSVWLCCAALSGLLGCSRGGAKSPSTPTTHKPVAKSATLYKDADQVVTSAEFVKTPLSPERIAELRKHPHLEELSFYECSGFNDAVCGELRKLQGITALHFVRSKIDDAALSKLSTMSGVKHVTLSSCNVTDKGVAALKSWKALGRLTLSGSMDLKALEGLSALKRVKVLEISVTGFAAANLAGHDLPAIRAIALPDTEVSDGDLAILPAWKSLEEFRFIATGITDDGARSLKKFPKLKKLALNESKVSDAALADLVALKNLEQLSLYGCKNVTDRGMKSAAALPKLERLQLESSGVSGAGLMFLTSARSLRYVGIGETQASKNEVAMAAARMPKCKIERIQQRPGPRE